VDIFKAESEKLETLKKDMNSYIDELRYVEQTAANTFITCAEIYRDAIDDSAVLINTVPKQEDKQEDKQNNQDTQKNKGNFSVPYNFNNSVAILMPEEQQLAQNLFRDYGSKYNVSLDQFKKIMALIRSKHFDLSRPDSYRSTLEYYLTHVNQIAFF